MPKFNSIKNSFLAGEWSPKCEGRTELPAYPHACKTLENMRTQIQGGANRRPGSQYIKTAAGPAKLIPFVFSQTEAYVVILTNNAISVVSANNPSATVTVNTSGITEVPNLYSSTQIFQVQFTQSADTLFLVHPSIKPQRLVRTASNTFRLYVFDDNVTGQQALNTYLQGAFYPYRNVNYDKNSTITPSGTSGPVTLTAASSIFNSGQIGSFFRITRNGTTTWAKITAVSSGTSASATLIGPSLPDTVATSNWEEAAWSTYRGWPATVNFFQGRVVYGGNTSQPDTFWGSQSSNYFLMMQRKLAQDASTDTSGYGFAGPVAASDPCSYTLSARQVNQIQWILGGKQFVLGSYGAEYLNNGIDPTSAVDVESQSTHGSAQVQAVRNEHTILYVGRSGRSIFEMEFVYASQAYVSTDLMVNADHMPLRRTGIPGAITQTAWAERTRTLWCVDSQGGLFSFTRAKTEQVQAFNYHPMGGTPVSGNSPAVYSVCVVPSADALWDDVWICVERVINGSTVYFIERIGREYEFPAIDSWHGQSSDLAPYFSDASILFDNGSPTTTVTGLSHLEGQTVRILADGYVQNPKVVTSGQVTLDTAATWAIVGLPYKSKIQTMRLEAGSAIGSAQGAIKNVDRTVVRFRNTMSALVGGSESTLVPVQFRSASTPMNIPTPLYTGDQVVELPSDYDRDGFVWIETDDPVPMSVTAIINRGETYDS